MDIFTLSKGDLTNLSSGLLEIALDSTLENGLLKDIPVIGTIISASKVVNSMREMFFAKKILRFLYEVKEVSIEERQAFYEKINKNEKETKRIGQNVILVLDRLDDELKASIIGRIYKACLLGKVTLNEYLRLTMIIERTFICDLINIQHTNNPKNLSKLSKEHLYSVGLLDARIYNKETSLSKKKRIVKKIESGTYDKGIHSPESQLDYSYNKVSQLLRKYGFN